MYTDIHGVHVYIAIVTFGNYFIYEYLDVCVYIGEGNDHSG